MRITADKGVDNYGDNYMDNYVDKAGFGAVG